MPRKPVAQPLLLPVLPAPSFPLLETCMLLLPLPEFLMLQALPQNLEMLLLLLLLLLPLPWNLSSLIAVPNLPPAFSLSLSPFIIVSF